MEILRKNANISFSQLTKLRTISFISISLFQVRIDIP